MILGLQQVALPWCIGVVLVLLMGGCFGGGMERPVGFASSSPVERIHASEVAFESRDVAAIPELIEALDSDDPAVRFYSIHVLTRLTAGGDRGYWYADEPHLRSAAVARWVKDWESDAITFIDE